MLLLLLIQLLWHTNTCASHWIICIDPWTDAMREGHGTTCPAPKQQLSVCIKACNGQRRDASLRELHELKDLLRGAELQA